MATSGLIPFSDLKTRVNKYILELWQFRRDEFLHNRFHKIFAKVYFTARYLLDLKKYFWIIYFNI